MLGPQPCCATTQAIEDEGQGCPSEELGNWRQASGRLAALPLGSAHHATGFEGGFKDSPSWTLSALRTEVGVGLPQVAGESRHIKVARTRPAATRRGCGTFAIKGDTRWDAAGACGASSWTPGSPSTAGTRGDADGFVLSPLFYTVKSAGGGSSPANVALS